MKGDFSLDLSLRAQRYSSVRFQQGRVLTDSDWNEQVEIVNLRAERQAEDVIGHCGAPMLASGFAVRATTTALAIHAVSSDEAWVVGEDAAILLLTKGSPDPHALRATLPPAAGTAHLRGVHFPSANQGYAVGDRGTLLSITPGSPGPVVARVPLADITADLRGVHFVGPTQGYAVGEEGTLLFITVTGSTATVERIAAPASGCLHAVHFVSATDGFAVGDDATVLALTAGSPAPVATRIDVPPGLAGHLYAVHGLNRDQCYAVGKDGTILFIDRNASPKATKLAVAGVTADLRAVRFGSVSQGYAVGDAATIVSIAAGGMAPVLKKVAPPPGVNADLRGVAFLAPTVGYAVGDERTVLLLQGLIASALSPLPAASLKLSAGRFYAHGTLCELHEETTYLNQPQSAGPPSPDPGTHLLYLDAWQRHVTYVEDPEILEVALGGPDTTTRTQTIAQVKALKLDPVSPSVSPSDSWNCLSDVPKWTALAAPRRARLKARARPGEAAVNVCDLPARGGFRRIENQLYRVEIHSAAPPTFKWSRDNGSVTYPVTRIVVEDAPKSQTVVTVAQRGRDPNLDLAPENWVEIVDDDLVLANRPGLLLEYDKDGNDPLEIVLKGVPGAGFTAGRDRKRHPLLRRWDHRAPTGSDGTLALEEGKWLELEDGVQVWFEPGGDYRPGDYWLVPARSANADVIWPADECGHPEALLPRGIQHAYCRLALVDVAPDSSITVLSDCRPEFPPLTELTQIYYVSGDGQDGPPGARLPKPLQVRVANGQHPVEGAPVRFQVEGADSGLLGDSPAVSVLVVTTDAEGLAECDWRLALYTQNPDNRSQRVTASLLDASASPVAGQVVRFNATASLALEYVSGDGQDGPPGVELPQRLVVRVANGQHPVRSARVRFTVDQGNGSLVAPDSVTDNLGLADCGWVLDASPLAAARPQRVRAELLDAAGRPIGGQIVAFCATATLSLQYVSGDGQEARPGNPLDHDLEVRVVNGQSPVQNARVRFTVSGGGSLNGVNPVTTSGTGLAQIGWRLGNNGPQRVVAQLIDGAGVDVPNVAVAFNATLSVAGEVAYAPGCAYLAGKTTVQDALDALCVKPDLGGHCVTIGRGGQVPKLTDRALEDLLKSEEWRGRLCLCFLPGVHVVEEPLSIRGNYRLSITGCGHTAVVTFKEAATFADFASIELANFALVCAKGRGLTFADCSEVRIAEMGVQGTEADAAPLLRFAGGGDITVSGCDIEAKGASQKRGIAVVFEDAKGTARFCENDVRGIVSLYGDPGDPGDLEKFVRALAKRIAGVKFAPVKNSAFFADRNNFDWLTIGKERVKQLESANEIPGVLDTLRLTDNVFLSGGNIVLGGFATVNASLFRTAVKDPSDGTLGSVIGTSAWGIGNDSPLAKIRTGDTPSGGPVLNLLASRTMSGSMMSHLRFGNMARVEMT